MSIKILKSGITCLIVLSMSINLFAQNQRDTSEYLFPSIGKYVSGFGYGPLIKFSKVGHKMLDGGGGGGGLIFLRKYFIAFYGHGTLSKLELDNGNQVAYNQVGGIIGYRFLPHKKFHQMTYLYFGNGELVFTDQSD